MGKKINKKKDKKIKMKKNILKSLVIMGFLGRLIPWDGFVNLLVIFENKACSSMKISLERSTFSFS